MIRAKTSITRSVSKALTKATKALKSKTISFDDWFAKYVPVINHFVEDCSHNGTMFETYGEEVEHVEVMAGSFPNHVHTIIEVADNFYILKGYHHVNRWGHFITKFPCVEDYSEILID